VQKSEMGWVDFSADDRERVKHALKQLAEPGTLDELGIGSLRDGFADLLFPGFSTIQTRAKYLITIPRMLRDYLALPVVVRRRQSPEQYLVERENKLAASLTKRHLGEGVTGIIGSSMGEGEGVTRHPSSVYWVALRIWGIVATTASRNQFLRSLRSDEDPLGSTLLDEVDDHDAGSWGSRIKLDRYAHDWFENVGIHLTNSEAAFLSEKLRAGPFHSLPTQFEHHDLRNEMLGYRSFPALAEGIRNKTDLPVKTRDAVEMAHSFSELICGAHIRFNHLVAVKGGRDDLITAYGQEWEVWSQSPHVGPESVAQWVRETGARPNVYTLQFLNDWSGAVAKGATLSSLDELVRQQAVRNKRERSILNKPLPREFGWIGMKRLDYRWSQVRTILSDIREGLAC